MSTSFVWNDEEAIMFSCVTTGKPGIFEGFNPTPKSFPDEVALKIYIGDLGKEENFTELALIDEQLTKHLRVWPQWQSLCYRIDPGCPLKLSRL